MRPQLPRQCGYPIGRSEVHRSIAAERSDRAIAELESW
jgi:hypothetical protein